MFNKWSLEDILVLACSKGINLNLLKSIPEKYDSFDDFCYFDNLVSIPGLNKQPQLFLDNLSDAKWYAEKQLNSLNKNPDFHIISLWDDNYPELLKNIEYPPVLLFVWGDLKPKSRKSISIVGTRKNSLYGKLITEKFSEYFSKNDIIVTSGLAYGIDSIAHNSCISKSGTTYAVIASGLDRINPSTSQDLAKKIVDANGCIISEYKFGTVALPGYFPQRNRIISGISIATLVIESAAKGGSLITANFAFDQQREVFAVPGRISDERSRGTNYLIKKQIAQLAYSPEEMLRDLGFDKLQFNSNEENINYKPKNENEAKILSALNSDPIHIDILSGKTNIDNTDLLVILLDLEFSGVIRKLPGQHYIKNI